MQAGISKHALQPIVGSQLMGYGNRESGSDGIHAPIYVRALALQQDDVMFVICSIEICYLRPPDVRAIQAYVEAHSDLHRDSVLLTTTHTHSAPGAHDDSAWKTPFVAMVGDTIIEASLRLQPAKMGVGAGFLYGYSINRRWLDRPIDPSVSVIRVDTINGNPLAIIGNYACHSVVLGYDNLKISGDWSGYASRLLEAELGADCIVMVTQGGAGDINPLTETVRQRLQAGHPVTSIGELTTYYYDDGTQDDAWNIEDRAGGTFVECETIARAYNATLKRVWRTISLIDAPTLSTASLSVSAMLADDEPPAQALPTVLQRFLPDMSQETMALDIRVIQLGDTIIMTQPGEVFSETAVNLRKMCQQMGYKHAISISYANGSYGYLPPENAFAEGGYEVIWALGLGISRHLQTRIQSAIRDYLHR
ncbi:MAG: neutral/alkaline non-lysosomal ceramidase N-terminal domain-containing protein [Chloroflexota bacterium]